MKWVLLTMPRTLALLALVVAASGPSMSGEPSGGSETPIIKLDLSATGWRALGQADFVNVNCVADTWTWHDDSVQCPGKSVGVIRTHKPLENLEMSTDWFTHGDLFPVGTSSMKPF